MAIQPFFTLSTNQYFVRRIHALGITQIYAYTPTFKDDCFAVGVPDASIDIRFDFNGTDVQADVFGPVSSRGGDAIQSPGHTYFGIRFEPGILPPFLNGTFADFVGRGINLSDCAVDTAFIQEIGTESNLARRSDLILQSAAKFYDLKFDVTPSDKAVLVQQIAQMIVNKKGLISIDTLSQAFGYTPRYIDKLFKTFMGMSPKKFSEAMRFQHSLMHLTRGNYTTITDVAQDAGYYDQAQMTRDFKKATAMTPKKFRKRIITSHYTDKFVNY